MTHTSTALRKPCLPKTEVSERNLPTRLSIPLLSCLEVQACPEHVPVAAVEWALEVSVSNICETWFHGVHVVPCAVQPLLDRLLTSSSGIAVMIREHVFASRAPVLDNRKVLRCAIVAYALVTAPGSLLKNLVSSNAVLVTRETTMRQYEQQLGSPAMQFFVPLATTIAKRVHKNNYSL
jgi:hypothetical protein